MGEFADCLAPRKISPSWRVEAATVRECFQSLAKKDERLDNCSDFKRTEEPSPMWIRESDRSIQYNWIAILSYTASLAVSLAIWKGLFRAVQFLVK